MKFKWGNNKPVDVQAISFGDAQKKIEEGIVKSLSVPPKLLQGGFNYASTTASLTLSLCKFDAVRFWDLLRPRPNPAKMLQHLMSTPEELWPSDEECW